MSNSLSLSLLPFKGKKVAVISHERSGTHFLMNTIAENFGYTVKPWLNFDFDLRLNFHSPKALGSFFSQLHNQPVANILKSHHTFDFFSPVIDEFCNDFKVLYIYRDPRDAIISNWKLINSMEWHEGPQNLSARDFLFHAPTGAMMRYQKHNEESMLSRWDTHITGWMDFAENDKKQRVLTIKYEDLNQSFDESIKSIGKFLGLKAKKVNRPDIDKNVIGSGKGVAGTFKEHLSDDDNDLIIQKIGESMRRFGYET